eukprot:TRINITY_DN79672_c0_g1_i4.p1 TRINITY_DN79672_c0_g1~~TRINITY_DN79672_c0_g1_i4.p1  ORF type:complete len:146 (-),score=16.80 TRINITY_DN79672_c0_g1_i4:71-508(-)
MKVVSLSKVPEFGGEFRGFAKNEDNKATSPNLTGRKARSIQSAVGKSMAEVSGFPENDLFVRYEHLTEQQRFDNLYKWLTEAGSNIENIDAITYSKNYRGLHAKKDLKATDVVISIPHSHVIWTPMVSESYIGRKLKEAGYELEP